MLSLLIQIDANIYYKELPILASKCEEAGAHIPVDTLGWGLKKCKSNKNHTTTLKTNNGMKVRFKYDRRHQLISIYTN